MSNNIQISNLIANLLEQLNVSNVCVSPGARNAPMIEALSKSSLKMHSILDERAAGFYALGMAKKTDRPVALSCTSGTALANFFPAIIEAYMSETPLIIISADRPVQSIDTGSNQTIYQDNIYGKYSLHFEKINSLSDDLDSICNKINVAFHASMGIVENKKISSKGPVHINIHFDEPLINSQEIYKKSTIQLKKIESLKNHPSSIKNKTVVKNPVIICGQSDLKKNSDAILDIAHKIGSPILSDISSNIKGENQVISFYDHFTEDINPDLILRFGRKPLSKKLLSLLEKNNEITHLIRLRDAFNDDVNPIEISIDSFAENIDDYLDYEKDSRWLDSFINQDALAKQKIASLSKDVKINEYSFANELINILPDNSNLFIGNSLMIRAFNSFSNRAYDKNIHILSNRGASGIDGNIATALGIAQSFNKNNYLVIGDQSFMHDIGSLQILSEIEADLTVFIINNRGGSIFSQLPLSNKMDLSTFNQFVRRSHNQNFEAITKSYNIDYTLITTFEEFKNLDMNKAQICEVMINQDDSLNFIKQFS
tara:strand:- start:3710 stop:5335 length:1626 start_codon:yes stop_codon:yes gene_type:complete